jgi:hypothetical protein
MAVSRAMRRLLRVREIEEELSRAALESATGDLNHLEAALATAEKRERGGRRLVAASVGSGEIVDRIAGLEETGAARRHAAALKPMIADMELVVTARRQEFLAKRIERRQVETLIRETEAGDAIQSGRRSQRELDDWFLSRTRRGGAGERA